MSISTTSKNEFRILDGDCIRKLLAGNEANVVQIVKNAYTTYGKGAFSLPHSVFLRFEEQPANRIIGLPAYLGNEFNVAGLKWVSSFPGNLEKGIDRASATLTLNDMETGRPIALLEASSINACRTAASAALAAQLLHDKTNATHCSLIGCGYIGFECLNYLKHCIPSLTDVTLLDLDESRAKHLAQRLDEAHIDLRVQFTQDIAQACQADIVVFATTAGTPWLLDETLFSPETTVLHVSLRDLGTQVMLSGQNIADDIDHVCRANTSPHLTEMETGNRDFMTTSLPDVLAGNVQYQRDKTKPLIFSPFGLGILDIAVGQWLLQQAIEKEQGTVIHNFFPTPWKTDSEKDSEVSL
ncbi:2,3-diaminopropionate biosynthesis protein SbnB [Paraneptunicella aestuarii]|uniref:2,3-diaminopropionate biosynthesis protein SbnB n=1 Tax=Paraneptunicella aestuarii TaxID=2831148 RepID=UPI001E3341DC|nr:2,3-diaminopropionate biosynthesis protein SbnB [Paraneptunicella aestuarii]UAA40608.1 2,3-diaminopropionate biosynthesis protein SbnB [Paraneptunicella aestuarii]